MKPRRLLKLADYLDRVVPRGRFNMRRWAYHKGSDYDHCGFAGCALGWACYAELFKGLKFSDANDPIPEYEDSSYGYHAASRLFAIERSEASYLFSAESYTAKRGKRGKRKGKRNLTPTPKQVARRIRRFVDGQVVMIQ